MSVLERVAQRVLLRKGVFEFFQRLGVHIVPNHFYEPVPDTRELERRSAIWDSESALAGVDMNLPEQMRFLTETIPLFRQELGYPRKPTGVPHEYFIDNNAFGLLSAAVLHCMIRSRRPGTVLEVGSGNSTFVSARACLMNQAEGHPARLVAIEPYPKPALVAGVPGLSQLLTSRAEEVPLATYTGLQSGDILFIDSSHVVKTGSDVLFLYLEVLPRLVPGVVVHIHDIFFPRDYPRDWVLGERRFWNEQYLLQAFLMFNRTFEVLWCGSYMYARHLDRLKAAIPPPPGLGEGTNYFSSSIWLRRRD